MMKGAAQGPRVASKAYPKRTNKNVALYFNQILFLFVVAWIVHVIDSSWNTREQQYTRITPPQVSESKRERYNHTYNPDSVAICVIARNEHLYIEEFVAHHVRLGVSKIYLFEHGDSPDGPMWPFVLDYIKKGLVEYTAFTHFVNTHQKAKWEEKVPQGYVYTRCLDLYGHLHGWMAFLDVDEFIMLRGEYFGLKLPEVMQRYKQYPAVAVHWRVFGNSGYPNKTHKSVLASYHNCVPTNYNESRIVKTIAQPKNVIMPKVHLHRVNPHNASAGQYMLGTVKEDFTMLQPEDGSHDKHFTGKLIVIHHYVYKSTQEGEEKANRERDAWLEPEEKEIKDQWRGAHYFRDINGNATDFCLDGLWAAAQLPKLKTPQIMTNLSLYKDT